MSIPAKQVTAIIGPSGGGKSSFLRCLNRMHDLVPQARVEGEIRLFGELISGDSIDSVAVRRRVGMVFEKPNPFPNMSILENVTVGLRLIGIRKREALAESGERALRQAALWEETKDRLSSLAVKLSPGQQQRLCIARALAMRPEVLLLEEPASPLDPIATGKIEDLILDLKRNLTLVVVTHNMQQAARISDCAAFIYAGQLVEQNSTSRIFTNPAKKQTEDYVTGRLA